MKPILVLLGSIVPFAAYPQLSAFEAIRPTSTQTNEKVDLRLKTKSGQIERIVLDGDERRFGVKLTRPDQSWEWLEAPPDRLTFESVIVRYPLPTFSDDEVEGVFEVDFQNRTKLLGVSPRVFDKERQDFSCEAEAFVSIPSPLTEPSFVKLGGLECDGGRVPKTTTEVVSVAGKDMRSWVTCVTEHSTDSNLCRWVASLIDGPEAAVQTSCLTFLQKAHQRLLSQGIEFQREPLRAWSMAFSANRSSYSAESRTLFYGGGKFWDGLDGFVVVHEWWHAVIDDLNRGLFGYEAQVLHEALSDFGASGLFDDACFAPFDAQEIEGRRCVRDLSSKDANLSVWSGNNAHADALILSSSLWEISSILGYDLVSEIMVEALARLSKKPTLLSFVHKLLAVYERLLNERPTLTNQAHAVEEILIRRGFRIHTE